MRYSPIAVKKAARALAAGGVIAHPTESVWGLACDPNNHRAVQRLLQLKDRPVAKGLILVSGEERHFAGLLDPLDERQLRQIHTTWPGPVTWLVPHCGRVPSWISGAHQSVALRCTDHPFTAALTRAFGGAIVSTSANPSGCQPARHKYQVLRYFGDTLDFVGGGATGGRNAPSEIRDLISGEVLRPGG
ncbi:L-threonylcarbamoyladenylate synthase [Microbulbifer thermotolerans]|uniref:Threonylcarbamoyl-AMP synthase n=1 Tax=Microbulbifer thermotolerans TaxID=252514 RepID=A0AB35HVT1_MICTH|nr:Sua5/YciO/YrdC/YwlC family protein [Microbulbifer thermotolerans]MCX2778485.1 Sua5/YciO/YrdC/YwlC family protein [Microbulbifer thermotolerans]MCX2783956.1 Sua5/YciO/YrdC/YwlC family protein [Microbulbifer thermotolerans]MCX2801673.1 Sua5/YciO/YrdC/YwlC family protein [Microbulbifer thermotolerans]MCX2804006.1 Sua5/YciO/YrdC/YwlC family protein [Microbulbifer thermotolerans]MCX2830837.1 Sua5/YciO/YrdC/YwlC family protein [Microbulbifer thermotolerans]